MPFSTRPFSMPAVMICLTVTALSLPAFAQTAEKASPAVQKEAAGLAASPAMRVYDGSVLDCFKEATNIDPVEAARTKNTQALNMDPKVFMRIQECMTKKGLPANFDSYYTGKSNDPVAGRRKDIQEIQSALDSGKAPALAAAPAPTPVPMPSTPLPQKTVAPPPAAVPVPAVPEPEKPKVDPAEGGAGTKAPRPSRQYWVTPE